jgi:hypothetical protein
LNFQKFNFRYIPALANEKGKPQKDLPQVEPYLYSVGWSEEDEAFVARVEDDSGFAASAILNLKLLAGGQSVKGQSVITA